MSKTSPTPIVLTDEEWARMTVRRREENQRREAKGGYKNRIKLKINEPEYKRMVEVLLSGREDWKAWQDRNPFFDEYDFSLLDFYREINIHNTSFKKDVTFYGAKFFNHTYFTKSFFDKEVNFYGAQFYYNSGLWGTTFYKYINFLDAVFKEDISFNNARFIEDANFIGATFIKDANFTNAQCKGIINFTNGEFYGTAEFDKMILGGDSNLIFERCNFYHTVPNLKSLNRAPDIRFDDFNLKIPEQFHVGTIEKIVKFFLKNNPKIINFFIKYKNQEFQKLLKGQKQCLKMYLGKAKNSEYHVGHLDLLRFYHQRIKNWLKGYQNTNWIELDKDYEDRYRKLKELAIANHNHEYELKFNGYEMESKIINFCKAKKFTKIFGKDSSWTKIILLQLYKWTSNFGQSIGRPIGWLIILFLFYNIIKNFNYIRFLPEQAIFSILTDYESIKIILPVVSFDKIDSYADLLTKIFATILWFLLGLGIRNNFKIK